MLTKEFSQVGPLRDMLNSLPGGRPIMCQVVGVDGSAWNVFAKFTDLMVGNDMALLTMYHPDLTSVAEPAPDTFTAAFLSKQSEVLERIINATPTSEKRNIMCDINIFIMDAARKLEQIEKDASKLQESY
jgi:hypothetical protein